MSQIAPY